MTGAGGEGARVAALAEYDVVGLDGSDPVLADLRALCELAATVTRLPNAVVNLIDDRFQHQVAAFGVSPEPCRRDEAMCQTTLARGHDIYLRDASLDPRFASSPWVDGRRARIRCYASSILRNPAGHALGTLCVFDEQARDVTSAQLRSLRLLAGQVVDVLELRLRTRQLERANAELAGAQDRMAAFAGQLSHDLKAPITAVIGFAELLSDLDTVAGDASAAGYVARCSSAAKRMLGMVDELLAYARLGPAAAETVTSIPLAPLVEEVVRDLGPAAADATVTASGPDVRFDRSQFRALLTNLVRNAVTYRGNEPCVVEVTSERLDAHAVVRVRDNGRGIPADQREEVLRPLTRLDKAVPGAGLGLAVCARIAAGHGGDLRLEETPGGGTTAVITLPQ